MKVLLKITILLSVPLFLSGCKNRYYKRGYADATRKLKAEIVEKENIAFKNGRNQGMREGLIQGREEGRLTTQQDFITKQAQLISLSTEYFKRNFNFPTFRGNQMFEAFIALEQGGNNQALDDATLYIGNEMIRLVDQQHPLDKSKKREALKLLQVSYHDISLKIRNDYLSSPRLILNPTKTFTRSNEFSMRADLIARVIASNICSFSTKIFTPLNIALDFPVNLIAGKIMQSPCEALLNSMANVIAEEVSRTGLIKDIVNTSTFITTTGRQDIAELSTASIEFSIQKNIQHQRSFLFAIWTSATVKSEYKVTVKAGFNFAHSFVVKRDDINRRIYIHLPSAEITNVILEPTIFLIDDGGIQDVDANISKMVYDSVKQQAINHAMSHHLFDRTNENAKKVLLAFYRPIAENPFCPYKIEFITTTKRRK